MKNALRFYFLACLLVLVSCTTSKVLPTVAHGALDFGVDELQKLHQGGIIRVGLEKTSAHEYKTPLGFLSYQVILHKNLDGKDSLIVAYRINYPIIKDSAHKYIDRKLLKPKTSYNFTTDMKKSYSMAEVLGTRFWCLEPRFFDVMSRRLVGKGNGDSFNGFWDENPYITPKDDKSIVDGVKQINIHGTMSAGGGLSSTGTKELASQIRDAEKNALVSAILLDVNTNGGSVDAIQELYNAVKNCSKPIVAIANDNMHSAGYWASCGADFIYANTEASSFIGSIGVYMVHTDYSKENEMLGLACTYITAEQSTLKVVGNPDSPLSNEDKALLQAETTEICTAFINDVKSVRKNLPAECFTGQSFSGKRALELGLVDSIGTREQAIQKAKNLAMRKRVA
jgi:signal peptide peptidase SppA